MTVKLIRWLRGFVCFSACGKFPERFLNLTVKYGIHLWDARPVEGGMQGAMSLYDYRRIRKLCKKARMRARITKRSGLPFLIKKYEPRVGIPIGAVLGAVLLFVLSNFIWVVSVPSTENVSSSYMLGVLEENGVYVGSYINSVDVQEVVRNSILEVDEIGWMSVNIKGCTAEVNINEKTPKPDTADSKTPCNIKAKADGVITSIKVFKGEAEVVKGSGVAEGELLVSGVIETQLETVEYVHASAEIYADVISKKEINIEESFDYYSPTGNKTERYTCKFLCFEFPCSFSFGSYEDEVTENRIKSLCFNGAELPLSLKTETKSKLIKTEASLTEEQAETLALEKAVLYEVFERGESTLVSRNISIEKSKSGYNAKVNYVFNENIAVVSEFEVTD